MATAKFLNKNKPKLNLNIYILIFHIIYSTFNKIYDKQYLLQILEANVLEIITLCHLSLNKYLGQLTISVQTCFHRDSLESVQFSRLFSTTVLPCELVWPKRVLSCKISVVKQRCIKFVKFSTFLFYIQYKLSKAF